MAIWMLLLGAAVILTVLTDALTSTLSIRGAGAVTRSVMRGTILVGRAFHRLTGSRKVLRSSGVIALVATALSWVLFLWGGWLLVFSASPGAVVDATTLGGANLPGRIYFSGFTVFTLGTGDFIPRGALFQILTPLATLTGLFLVTLAITYLVPVVSAAVDKRRIALSVQGMGETPSGIVERAWDGSGFPGLEDLLASISSAVTLHGERHLAYPIVHYYFATHPGSSAPVRIAALDEAVTLLAHAVDPEVRPGKATLAAARSAVTSYLDTLSSMYVSPAREVPPLPDIGCLGAAGVPIVDDHSFAQAVRQLEQRRRLLLANVLSSGWTWEEVVRRSESSRTDID